MYESDVPTLARRILTEMSRDVPTDALEYAEKHNMDFISVSRAFQYLERLGAIREIHG